MRRSTTAAGACARWPWSTNASPAEASARAGTTGVATSAGTPPSSRASSSRPTGRIPPGGASSCGSRSLPALELEVDQLVPCGLVLGELLANALVHGGDGPRGERDQPTRLEVGVERDGATARLWVEDGGAGPPPDFDVERADGLGLKLVARLARQLGGELAIGPGARFELAFPLPPDGAANDRGRAAA